MRSEHVQALCTVEFWGNQNGKLCSQKILFNISQVCYREKYIFFSQNIDAVIVNSIYIFSLDWSRVTTGVEHLAYSENACRFHKTLDLIRAIGVLLLFIHSHNGEWS